MQVANAGASTIPVYKNRFVGLQQRLNMLPTPSHVVRKNIEHGMRNMLQNAGYRTLKIGQPTRVSKQRIVQIIASPHMYRHTLCGVYLLLHG